MVINLTKTQGPGSLAHEWFHALDNYFARLDRTGSTAPTPVDGYGTRDTARPQNMRPEVWQAFKGIRDVVNRGDFSRRSGALDATRSKPYFGTTIEKAARAFETYVEERLAKTGISNDYLVNIDKAGSDAYPTTPELDGGIRGAYDNLFNTLDTKQTDKGTALYAAAPEAEPGGEQGPVNPTRVPTIKELVDETTSPNPPTRRRFTEYATVTPEQAAQMQRGGMPDDLSGYRRNVDANAIRHTLKSHGDPAAEISRGNLPLDKADFERLPQLLDHPDATLYVGKNERGLDVMLSAKRVNGHFVIAEERREGKTSLNLVTMYKKSAPPLARGADGQPDPALLQSAAQAMLQQAAREFNFWHGRGQEGGSTLAAAAPEATDPAESPLFDKAGTSGEPASSTLKRGSQAWAKAKLAEKRAKSALEDSASGHHDAVETMAGIAGRQAKTSIRYDMPNALDRQAAGPVVEAGGDRARLAADLAKVQASPNPKLAAKYAPIYQHALDNLPRLNAAADGYRQMDAREDAAAERAGLPPQWQARSKHVYEDPTSPQSTVPLNHGFGATKGFKTAADAIAAGVDPKSTDLGDLAERRVQRNQQAINEHAFQGGLASLKATDGQPLIKSIQDSGTQLNAAGDPFGTAKVPAGYKAVQAGPNVLVAHKEIAPLLEAFYGDDDWQNNFLGKHLLDLAAFAKHGTVGIGDTYHGMRQIFKGLLGFQTAGWDKGLAAQDYSEADLPRAVKAGEISQAEADFANQARPVVNLLHQEGLNTGKVSDNLLEASRQHNLIERIPVVGKLNGWVNDLVFHKIQRGIMTQAGVIAFNRNKARFPNLSDREVARQSAKEVNEYFGNLGTQGLFKSKNMQNAARVIFLAPQFAEAGLRSEMRGAAQAAKIPVDGVSGRGWRVGVMAQAVGSTIMAMLIGNQVLNYFTRGHSTFENPEDGHKLDAWIPGGPHGKGFFFSPLSVAAEYTHALWKYMDHRESAVDSLTHIASNKLSGPSRAVKDLATGKDYKGQPFSSMGERLKAAAADALPLPMPLTPLIQKNPASTLGYGLNHEKGAVQKQLLSMAGLKVDPADSARSQMFNLAQQFRGPQADQQHGPSAYAALRTALGNEDADGARAEVQRLVTEGHKTLGQIADKAAGIKDGNVHPELFTGSREKDLQMLASLTPAQKQVYRQAFQDRVADARLLTHIFSSMTPEQKQALRTASAMNARGNKTGAAQVGKSSVLQPDQPVPAVPAQPAAPPPPRPRIADSFR